MQILTLDIHRIQRAVKGDKMDTSKGFKWHNLSVM